ncbi:MAG: hypothetical protein QF890_15170 [Myxococcota bacterium]|jgi:hypothetical protein|nr:hypothetical protein [Myxococcota bacterium]MDP7301084.1 hypothetical protein [Myxococcota bacterium]MDP7433899.1 hypothetical protein [Myxococcota bacterium]
MLRHELFAAVAFAAATACSTTAPPAPERTSLPVLAAGDTDASLGYETPPVQNAAALLPSELREGPHHYVADEVQTDGFMRVYEISSPFGEYTAYGDDSLRERVAEIEALAQLRERSAGAEFGKAVQRSLGSPFVATWNLVTRPSDSEHGVPEEAADALRGAPTGSTHRDEFFGFAQRKRELAFELGVDPYSSNAELQKELNRFAWVSTVGGFGERIFTPGHRDRSAEIVRDFSPTDLQRLARVELAVMGISEDSTEAFIAHPWYSPRQQAELVGHLAALDLVANRRALIDVALGATSEEDANLYARSAELLHAYHDNVTPFELLTAFRGGTVAGFTRDGRLVAVLPLDYAIWTKPAHAYANTLKRSTLGDGRAIDAREVLVTGSFSPKARSKYQRRGITVRENALEALRPEPVPEN